MDFIRFTLEMDGLRSVIDCSVTPHLTKNIIEQMILDEVKVRFTGNFKEVGEDRFVDKNGGFLKGRYSMDESENWMFRRKSETVL